MRWCRSTIDDLWILCNSFIISSLRCVSSKRILFLSDFISWVDLYRSLAVFSCYSMSFLLRSRSFNCLFCSLIRILNAFSDVKYRCRLCYFSGDNCSYLSLSASFTFFSRIYSLFKTVSCWFICCWIVARRAFDAIKSAWILCIFASSALLCLWVSWRKVDMLRRYWTESRVG